MNATSAATLDATGKVGQVVYLTEDFEGFAKGTLVQWDGTAWKEYEGVIEA